ncbi:MAG TPA: DUF2520 domain-containing protein [Bacteroidota bacterium]|nr:DUF2520 domain-containing protein [Bacteroidota bacterium]
MNKQKSTSRHFYKQAAVSIVGAGSVGTSLALLLHKSHYPFVSVISRKKTSAKKLALLVHCMNYSCDVADIHLSTRIVILTVSDSSLAEVAKQIAQRSKLDFKSLYVCHTSGSLTSDVLKPLQEKGAMVFSMHPIQTFPSILKNKEQQKRMRGIWYGIEGNSSTLRFAKMLVRSLDGNAVVIPKEEKILYHIGCVLASNYIVTLLGSVEQLFRNALPVTLKQMQPLIQASIDNTMNVGASRALTGPIARGDVELIHEHLSALKKIDNKILKIYRVLGKQAIDLAIKEKKISNSVALQLKELLRKRKRNK